MKTHNDMLRISLVSGFHIPRNSCSKFDMRATPDPTMAKRMKNVRPEEVILPSRLVSGLTAPSTWPFTKIPLTIGEKMILPLQLLRITPQDDIWYTRTRFLLDISIITIYIRLHSQCNEINLWQQLDALLAWLYLLFCLHRVEKFSFCFSYFTTHSLPQSCETGLRLFA